MKSGKLFRFIRVHGIVSGQSRYPVCSCIGLSAHFLGRNMPNTCRESIISTLATAALLNRNPTDQKGRASLLYAVRDSSRQAAIKIFLVY